MAPRRRRKSRRQAPRQPRTLSDRPRVRAYSARQHREIILWAEANPAKTIRQLAADLGYPRSCVHRVLQQANPAKKKTGYAPRLSAAEQAMVRLAHSLGTRIPRLVAHFNVSRRTIYRILDLTRTRKAARRAQRLAREARRQAKLQADTPTA